jgi:digeranylgeranylglycerophospholipid reductase
MKCDILVVGAGPAGSMAAKTAAERNAEVIMIERNQNIGSPVKCAEGINKFLFQDTGIKKDGSFIEQKMDGAKFYFYDEVYEIKSEQWEGYTINRKIFDKYLAKHAQNAGTKLFTKTKAIGMKRAGNKWNVKIKSEDFEMIETKIVIGADGVECNVGKWAGIKKTWGENDLIKCYELLLNCPNLNESNKFHLAFGEEFPKGYAWIFPKNKAANVGVGVTPKESAKKALDFFIKRYPRISDILGDYSIIEPRGGYVPVSGPKKINETVTNGVILTGDAAGIVDPITGEGISSSMISGLSAGEVAAMCMEKNNWDKEELKIYDKMWRNKKYMSEIPLGQDFDMLTEIKELFYNIFTRKDIPKKARESLISAITLVDEEKILESLSRIERIIKN